MICETRLNRIYRASAWYDLIVTAPLAIYPGFLLVFWALNQLHGALGIEALPPFTALGVMFANFTGSVVIVWSLVRLRWDDVRLARYDAAARWLFSAAMLVALWHGASPILVPVVIIEIAFGVLQSLPLRPREA
ncbi:hypothetical protein SAMN04488030_3356 [Aliiroseovarius halocynthiae]|uniref:MFS transporter n=1 Tax=Aliiroseovarius halocynthiae TaxID=985055 RepID=A0A545SLS3_9RHOB|nr:hypothetical protein [Aliiroseovarius halocynthiae]TQV65930.1 hypothetical protein FIL88_15705 [Aliiroseovarius halocynthiae]SMR83437.1 hypothetical protein SAMN04488030_3356 [Aliiroseovarius halocynthiae]